VLKDKQMQRLLPGVLILVCCGCGSDLYEQRLMDTAQYFRYESRLNKSLKNTWGKGGISLRPPRQMTELAPPAEDPNAEEPPTDPRQPPFIELQELGLTGLPGLEGSWVVDVDVTQTSGTVKLPA